MTNWKKLSKRGLSLLVALMMCLGMLNINAFAAESEPACGQAEHTHTDACYTETETLSCVEVETEGHSHSDDCYAETETLSCSSEEEDHVHEDGCYTRESNLDCGLTKSEGHAHGDGCYTTVRELTCGLTEHTHTDACYETEELEEIVDDGQTAENGAPANDASQDGANGDVPAETAVPENVQAFLDVVAELPGTVTEENAEEVLALVEAIWAAYDALDAADCSREDVADALATFQSMMEEAATLAETEDEIKYSYVESYTENAITYELREDGTAKVISGEKDKYYRIIVPATVTYDGVEYRVTVIGENAFYNKGYAQVTLNEGLETIETYAFGYTYLYKKDLVIPDSVTSIGDYAFKGFNRYASEAYHISKIVLGDSLETIGYCAFYYNAGVTAAGTVCEFPVAVECGTNLKSVDSWAFYRQYDYNDVSSVTVRGYEDSAIASVLEKAYAFSACGVDFSEVDINNITSVKSLQKAIDESNGPTTLTLNSLYFTVKDSIVIPSGKDITLTDNGTQVVFETYDYAFSKPMFIIEKGGKLTIDATDEENLLINGNPLGTPGRLEALVFQVNGELVLENAIINGGGSGYGMGMFSGAIVLGDNAKFEMTGGTLRNTIPNGAHGAPVVVGSGAQFTMSGGKITDNYSTSPSSNYAAGAVLLYGWNASDVGGKMILTGNAEISNNSTSGAGGAITLVGNAELYMDGGVITGNSSNGGTNSVGGGVCVAGRTGGMSKDYDAKCVFTMDGGEISNNYAHSGGGVYVYSNYVTLSAGKITGNKAARNGGGVYVETPEKNPTSLKMTNALITNNTATTMGGGMFFCPTGSGKLYVNEGCAIFDNSANGTKSAADDFVSVMGHAMDNTNKSAVLAERMLGGGKVNWHLDGSVAPSAGLGSGVFSEVTSTLPRFDPENPGTPVAAGTYENSIALKAVVTDGAKALAEANATLIITGNTAAYGGGVGANGSVTAGNPDKGEYSFTVHKAWEDIPESEWKPVTVQLMIGDYGVETVELNADNNWSATFTGLPESVKGNVSVKEVTQGYDVSYSEVEEDGTSLSITVTNAPLTSLTVEKVWANDTEATRPASVTVQLYDDGAASGEPVTLNAANDWSYTWPDLPASGHNWTVDEVDVPAGYTSSVSASGTTVTITNTYNPPETPNNPNSSTTSLTVNKVWVGDGDIERPASVTVQLYRDGSAYGSRVTLNEANDWSYTWSNLDDSYTWTVGEINVPEGYTSTVSQDGTTVTVTNTYEEEVPEPEVPLTEIPDEEPPLADIPEEDVPLADVPETGDNSGLWLVTAGLSAAGVAGVALTGKKREDDAL